MQKYQPLNITNTKGSILIWTVLIGMVLTSVFFFTATRLRLNTQVQRETIAIQNQRAYLQSYMDYVKEKEPTPETHTFDEMKIEIVNQQDTIEGFLDSGETKDYTDITSSDTVEVCWNTGTEAGDLLIENSLQADDTGNCSNTSYSSNVTYTPTTSLALQALNEPIHYYIKSTAEGTKVTDIKNTLTATVNLEYGEKITITQTF